MWEIDSLCWIWHFREIMLSVCDTRKPHHKVLLLLSFHIVLLGFLLSSSSAVFVVLVRQTCSLHYNKRMFKLAWFGELSAHQTKAYCHVFHKYETVPKVVLQIHGKFTDISKMSIWVLAKPVHLEIHGKVDDSIVYCHVVKERQLSMLVFHLRWSVGSQQLPPNGPRSHSPFHPLHGCCVW